MGTAESATEQPGITCTDLQRHDLSNVSSGKAAELATHVVERGKPLVVLAE